jgi:hypothetical protein
VGWPDSGAGGVRRHHLRQHSARLAAAIFIGCSESISLAWMSPVTITSTVQTSATPADNRADRVKAAASPPRTATGSGGSRMRDSRAAVA